MNLQCLFCRAGKGKEKHKGVIYCKTHCPLRAANEFKLCPGEVGICKEGGNKGLFALRSHINNPILSLSLYKEPWKARLCGIKEDVALSGGQLLHYLQRGENLCGNLRRFNCKGSVVGQRIP